MVPQPAFLPVDAWALGAVIALTAGAILLLLLEFVPGRENGSRGPVVSLLTLAAGAASVLRFAGEKRSLFGGMFVHDRSR